MSEQWKIGDIDAERRALQKEIAELRAKLEKVADILKEEYYLDKTIIYCGNDRFTFFDHEVEEKVQYLRKKYPKKEIIIDNCDFTFPDDTPFGLLDDIHEAIGSPLHKLRGE